ncbi:MAG: DinB family protein [Nocardioidaceae bacterium]|nr:DinB family protein [Nocardioidaceae bacterium]MCL2612918.1 DinB family protein [Nocardioidaceae bacterium]
MTPNELLTEAIGRVLESVEGVLDGLDEEALTARPTADANSIAWLIWHLTRVQDDHVADVAEVEQTWTAQGYADRFGLPFPVEEHGFGHTSEQVGQVRGVPAGLLLDYYRATHQQTLDYLGTVGEDDLDRVVDTRWDPPVTLGVRLVSVVNDCTQHVGQAAYVKGLLGG